MRMCALRKAPALGACARIHPQHEPLGHFARHGYGRGSGHDSVGRAERSLP